MSRLSRLSQDSRSSPPAVSRHSNRANPTITTKPDTHDKNRGTQNFNANLAEFNAMMTLLMPTELNRVIKSAGRRLYRIEKKGLTAASVKAILRVESDLTSVVQEYVQGRTLLQDWLAVMLATMVGAYLEEGLVGIATKNPNVLRDAPELGNDRILEAPSIEDLRAELRKQWAGKKLSGGPEKWLPRLHELGARGFKKDCAFRLQHLWDTRNLIVHGRGIATAAYLRKQGNPPCKVGERIRVSTALLGWWLDGIGDFVDPVDQFFLNYGVKKGSGDRLGKA